MSNITVAEILRIHGKWIKSKEFAQLVSEKLRISERMAYLEIKKAWRKKEILKIPLPDRTVLYSLQEFGYPILEKEKEILNFKDAFLLQCFKELEHLSHVGAKNPALGVNQLRLFISRLPEDLKMQLEPLTEQTINVVLSKQNEIEKQFIIRSESKPKLYALWFQALKLLINEVSKMLHEYQVEKKKSAFYLQNWESSLIYSLTLNVLRIIEYNTSRR